MGGIIAFWGARAGGMGGAAAVCIYVSFYLYLVFLFEMLELETIYCLTLVLRCVWVMRRGEIYGVVGMCVVWLIDKTDLDDRYARIVKPAPSIIIVFRNN